MSEKPMPAFAITKLLVRIVTTFLGGATIIGAEKIPAEGAVILAPNHRAHVDPPYLTLLTKRQQFYMAKEELFRNPLFGKYIAAMGAFPVKRGEVDRGALRRAIEHLKAGRILTVFPEGTRSEDGHTLKKAEKGVGLIAKQTGAAIVPIAVEGTEKVLPRGAIFMRPARVRLTVGTPFTAKEVIEAAGETDKDALTLIGERIMADIASMMAAKS
jgi:1-acyl-sn-glycerol-3-phosphate acyltransferase